MFVYIHEYVILCEQLINTQVHIVCFERSHMDICNGVPMCIERTYSLYVYICIRIYVDEYMYMYMYTCTCIYICICTLHICMYMCTCSCTCNQHMFMCVFVGCKRWIACDWHSTSQAKLLQTCPALRRTIWRCAGLLGPPQSSIMRGTHSSSMPSKRRWLPLLSLSPHTHR
jgi:hypothetical protein